MSHITQKYKNCVGYQETIDKTTEWSIIDLFGNTPVSPDEFDKLDPRLKWLGKCLEGRHFCCTCATLTPSDLTSHHSDCCNYLSEEVVDEREEQDLVLKGSVGNRQQPLEVCIVDGKLQITIGLENLSAGCEMENETLDVADSLEFGKEMVAALDGEDEILFKVFDGVAEGLIENGSLSLSFED